MITTMSSWAWWIFLDSVQKSFTKIESHLFMAEIMVGLSKLRGYSNINKTTLAYNNQPYVKWCSLSE